MNNITQNTLTNQIQPQPIQIPQYPPVQTLPPSVQPHIGSGDDKSKRKFSLKLIIGIIIFLSLIVGLSLSFYKSGEDEKYESSPQSQSTNKLNPGTGNLYKDIKLRLIEELE